MGRRPFLTRLALGRSAYSPLQNGQVPVECEEAEQILPEEADGSGANSRVTEIDSLGPSSPSYIQQFDNRGHPQNLASRASSRASRRAQNDVLASLGYLTTTDQSARSSIVIQASEDGGSLDERYGEVEYETEDGFWIDRAYFGVSSLVHGRFTYLRNRLQTFRIYAGTPLSRSLKREWANSGPLLLLFGGFPGDFLIKFSRQFGVRSSTHRLYEDFVISRVGHMKSPRFRYFLWCGAETFRYCVWIYYLTVIATLQFHSILQGLGLKSLRSFLPGIMALVPFTQASMIQPISLPKHLHVYSMIDYLLSLACSPIILNYALQSARTVVHGKLFQYIKLALPKPDNPDRASVEVALHRGEHVLGVLGLNFRYDKRRNLLLVEDVRTVRELAGKDWAAIRDRMASMILWYKSMMSKDFISKIWYLSPNISIHQNQSASACTNPFESAQEQGVQEEPRSRSPSRAENPGIRHNATNFCPPDSFSSSAPATAKDLMTFHDDSRPTHRVTLLTNFATSTISALISTTITHALLLPLEALLVRSVAFAYLSSAGNGLESSLRLRNEIYPLGTWFGMGLRGGGAMDYARKMILCFGMEMAVGYGVWQIAAGGAWWLGKSSHGWGRL